MTYKSSFPYTLTTGQYQEVYKEVLLFAQLGGVAENEGNLWGMCDEEFCNELLTALEEDDPLKVIDASADSFVTLVQLHNYYMSKPPWEQPFHGNDGWDLYAIYQIEYMIKCKRIDMVSKCMTNWMEAVEVIAKEYGFNIYKAIKEVNRSNMTKFVPIKALVERYGRDDNVLALAAEECEALSNGKYKDVRAEVVYYSPDEDDFHGEEFVVFRNNGGKSKVVKHKVFYKEPNFEGCWI